MVHKIKDAWRHGGLVDYGLETLDLLWIYQYIPIFLIIYSLYYFSDIFLTLFS